MDSGLGPDDDESGQWAEVVRLMARIVAGDREAVWELHDLAEPALARILRAEARRLDVRIGEEDLFDLTLDAVIDLANRAKAWKPDGALPWVWARHRVRSHVHDFIGTFADPLDDGHLDVAAPEVAPWVDEPRTVLRELARRHPSAHRLDAALSATVSDRDADIWLGVQLEKAAGNRSPAVTVGVEHDLRPDAVRKVVQRVGERVGERLGDVA